MLRIKRFNFAEKLKLQKEYETFVKTKAYEVGVQLNPLNVFTFISFINSKGLYIVEKKDEV